MALRFRVELPASSPEEEAAYWEAQREVALTTWRTLLLGIALLNLLWGAADSLVYHGNAQLVEASRPIRISTSTLAFALYLLLHRIPFFRRHPLAVTVTAVLAVGTQIAWIFSNLGGPGTLWFPLTFAILFIPMGMSFRLPQRVFVMVLFGICFATAYYGRNPQYLSEPHASTTLSYLAFVVVVGTAGGMVGEYWRRDAFFLRRQTERQSHLLADLNAHLESRVAEQTSELRLLARNLESAREAERAHIARELHDELGQQLTGLRYALKFTQVRYDAEPLSIRPALENLQDVLNQVTTTTRELVRELRPKVLDDLGLVSALDWLVRGFSSRTGLPFTFDVPGDDVPLDRESTVAAFRLVQEALTNVARHAQAKAVVVSIVVVDATVVLCVRDDGLGFDPTGAAGSGGAGLIGMRERIRAVGGTLSIDAAPCQGTTVTARLPFSMPQEKSA